MEIKIEGYGFIFSCNGCSRRSLIGNPKYKITKDLKDEGWKIERNGISWCPKCSGGGIGGGVWIDEFINIMRNRLKQIGLTVVGSSLGYDGRNTLTFKVTGRKNKEPMSAEDQAVLLANP